MKKIFLIMIFLYAGISYSQEESADLNGKIFHGTAVELTPPDVDRKPLIYNETIIFEDGKLKCETYGKYGAADSYYTSRIDGRRAVAMQVINFSSQTSGNTENHTASIDFNGNIFGGTKLNGMITIRYSDGNEVKFIIEAAGD